MTRLRTPDVGSLGAVLKTILLGGGGKVRHRRHCEAPSRGDKAGAPVVAARAVHRARGRVAAVKHVPVVRGQAAQGRLVAAVAHEGNAAPRARSGRTTPQGVRRATTHERDRERARKAPLRAVHFTVRRRSSAGRALHS